MDASYPLHPLLTSVRRYPLKNPMITVFKFGTTSSIPSSGRRFSRSILEIEELSVPNWEAAPSCLHKLTLLPSH
jgi:hypothetical protein